jgi:hypothetical protein
VIVLAFVLVTGGLLCSSTQAPRFGGNHGIEENSDQRSIQTPVAYATSRMASGGEQTALSSRLGVAGLSSTAPVASPPRHPAVPYPADAAPIGIADFGLTSGSSTEYSSTSFLAGATVTSLSVCASSPCGDQELSFQLNLNLGFENGGDWYVYWVQDVALIDTASNSIVGIQDNIWNFSAAGAAMYNSSVSGYGTVYEYEGQTYYAEGLAIPSGFEPISPGSFKLAMNTSVTSAGRPNVQFMFDFGRGFQTYDNVSFPFASSLEYSDGFIVDGETANPAGLAYDAEFVMGGPGDGATTIDESSNVQLTLQYWNGHNYESINNAENYGQDTAESISDANATGFFYTANGALFSQVSSGPESEDAVWFSSDISLVEMVGPGSCNAELEPGTGSLPYLGGNATIAVGATLLNFQVDCSGYTQSLGVHDLAPGKITILDAGLWTYLTFGESGLPSNVSWGVAVGGDIQSGASILFSFYLPTGSYSYTLSGGGGYLPSPSAGDVSVSAPGVGVLVDWSAILISSSVVSGGLDVGQSVLFQTAIGATSLGDFFKWIGLPAGCSTLDASKVSCDPSAPGSYSVQVAVTDSNGFEANSSAFSFIVDSRPSVISSATPGSVIQSASVTFSSVESGGAGGVTYAWSGLPPGCTSMLGASLTCVPSSSGSFTVSITATDRNGGSSTSFVNLTVNPGFLGFPALEGYGFVAVIGVVIGALISIMLVRRNRGKRSGVNRPVAERINEYSPKSRRSPVSDITIPTAEVWAEHPDRAEPSPQQAGEYSGGGGQESASMYWATPMLSPPNPLCWHCTHQNEDGSRYCTHCGLPLEPPPPSQG